MTAAEFAAEGWHDYMREQPPDRTVEFARDERIFRQPPFFARCRDLDPWFNVAGLWWREA